jgi:hypothetical protein
LHESRACRLASTSWAFPWRTYAGHPRWFPQLSTRKTLRHTCYSFLLKFRRLLAPLLTPWRSQGAVLRASRGFWEANSSLCNRLPWTCLLL